MRNQLMKANTFNQSLDMIYVSNGGVISKRRIKVLHVNEDNFRAYCYLRGAKRTFTMDNVLALVPVVNRERSVI